MTRPPPLPDAGRLIEVCEATWPPAGRRRLGAWTIRDGQGGGQRVSAATENWPVTDADLPAAEAAMRAMGQVPLFRVQPGEDTLDALLAHHGYELHDPVNIYAMPVDDLLGGEIAPGTAYAMWPPLELAVDIWADGGIDHGRQAVMDRAPDPKAAVLVRVGDEAGGVGFVGIHEGIAMLHAIHVLPKRRRQGAATLILRKAAVWASKNGADVISLIVTQGNHAANPLYVSLGMRLMGHYHYRRLAEGNRDE